jgi:hypothetical protein
MAFINIPDHKVNVGNANIEYANLETHVVLSLQRYQVLEDRVIRNEKEIEKIENQIKANKKFLLALAGAAATGLASFLLPILVAYFKN